MKMDIIANSGNDEFYTPSYAIEPIMKYVKAGSKIWCPFDTENSLFVKELRDAGCEVVYTHIADGKDFFKLLPPCNCDYIISNPPYSIKTEVLERLFDLDIPFAMLCGVVGLFESRRRFSMFRENDFEIMYLNRRVAYFKNYSELKPSLHPPFSSVYVCHKMLPQQIVFEEMSK